MSYHGPRDNGEGRPGDLPTETISHRTSTGSTTSLDLMADATNPTDSIAVNTPTLGAPTQKALPTPPHLLPILKLLRGDRSKSTADDRSRSPPQRDVNSSSSNATSRRLHFYQGSAASLPVIENLSATMEQSFKDSLQVLPLYQVRTHIQCILAQQQPLE